MFSLGPLTRLRLFGFLCPCHESDEEYAARASVGYLSGTSVLVNKQPALLSIREGPILQIESKRQQQQKVFDFRKGVMDDDTKLETPKTELPTAAILQERRSLYIPLADIVKMELIQEEPQQPPIILLTLDSQELPPLEIQVTTTRQEDAGVEQAVQSLDSILRWDSRRREDLAIRQAQEDAMVRLREERERLIMEEQEEYMAK